MLVLMVLDITKHNIVFLGGITNDLNLGLV